MNARAYVICFGILIVCMVIGTSFALSQGESWVQVFDRLIRFVPAIAIFTLLWMNRRRQLKKG